MIICTIEGCKNPVPCKGHICADCLLKHLRTFSTEDLMDVYTYLINAIDIPDEGVYIMRKMLGEDAIEDVKNIVSGWFDIVNKILLERRINNV